jgi:hypothetical protein
MIILLSLVIALWGLSLYLLIGYFHRQLDDQLELYQGFILDIAKVVGRALPFVQPRPDAAGRADGSFSEQIRAALIREDLEHVVQLPRR